MKVVFLSWMDVFVLVAAMQLVGLLMQVFSLSLILFDCSTVVFVFALHVAMGFDSS